MQKEGDNHDSRKNLCGKHIKLLRTAQGLTLGQVQAKLISEYNLDMDLDELERGQCEVTDIELAVLARLFAVTPEHLIFGGTFPDKNQLRMILSNIL